MRSGGRTAVRRGPRLGTPGIELLTPPLESQVVALLGRRGPLTGAELHHALGDDSFRLWKACMRSDRLLIRRAGSRYLRLDQNVEGYARLSPSILREFLTYSIVGLTDEQAALEGRAEEVAAHIATVTRDKLRLARRVVETVASPLSEGEESEERFFVLLAGDIVYDMAHDVPRQERSTGQMVRGSDVDLVVVFDDDAPAALIKQLDDGIYQQKYRHLINPSVREEIDYIVKRLSRLREQAVFDDFKKMVACKILQEGVLLYGSQRLFDRAKAFLDEYGVTERLRALQGSATHSRDLAEGHLLAISRDRLAGDDLYLFYTSEESEEFE